MKTDRAGETGNGEQGQGHEEHTGTSRLLHPVETVTTAVNNVPGATTVKGAFEGMLDTVGVVSPHTRRVAAYAGLGLLGAAGVVEWPVVAAGAAVVWLTQPRPRHPNGGAPRPEEPTAEGEKAAGEKAAGEKARAGIKAGVRPETGPETATKAGRKRTGGVGKPGPGKTTAFGTPARPRKTAASGGATAKRG